MSILSGGRVLMRRPWASAIFLIAGAPLWAARPDEAPAELDRFLKRNCTSCHRGSRAEAGLDLSRLPRDLADPADRGRWVRAFDRVACGEMPPKDEDPPDATEKAAFLKALGGWIEADERRRYGAEGRVRARRLTNLQLERSLHDLLGIDIPLAQLFPDHQLTHRYSTVVDGQPMSRYQVERHMEAVDRALDEALRRAVGPPDTFTKTFDAKGLSRTDPKRRCREPEVLDGHGVVWSGGPIFYGRIPATRADTPGWYRITIRAKALRPPKEHGVWCSVQTGLAVSSAPLMTWAGSFEATPEPRERTFEAWCEAGHMFEVRPADTTLKKGRFEGGQVGAGEGSDQDIPGLAMERIVWERFHKGPTTEQVRELLLGGLKVATSRDGRKATVSSAAPEKDLSRLITAFADRAFRRPVDAKTVAPYLALAEDALKRGQPLVEALRVGYRSVLCSPRFLYFQEQPGGLDDYGVASRLSYFLWNRPPDAELLKLAAAGELRRPGTLQAQARRLLRDPRGAGFVEDFAAEWLSLNEIDFTTPDRRLYRTFDDVAKNAMLGETHRYLHAMLDENLSVTHLVDSDFTYLNSRLARFYGIPGVDGDALRRVTLAKDHPRGGLLGQGAILKVTANGTTTSPVVRGVWINERILGERVPPPPPDVPAIEPDIRGTTSIRDQLAKHRSIESCAACHRKIDPPGFALENFDPAGAWRDRYGDGRKGAPIDAGYILPDGRKFKNLDEYRTLVTRDPARLARNVADQMLTYATGAPVGFADRRDLEEIVTAAAARNHGFASILEGVITSRPFLQK
jgi:hypothetical protein